MATTLATRKQSAAIREKMQQIRTELPYDVDDARQRVKQLSDWKYHLSRHAVPILAASVVAGFVIVPRKRSSQTVVVHREPVTTAPEPAKRGLLGGVAAALTTMLLRQAASAAMAHASARFAQRPNT